MVVGRSNFDLVVERLRKKTSIGLDCESTGLRPYHGDKLFSLILACEADGKEGLEQPPTAYYFNFWPSYEGLAPEFVLTRAHLEKLKVLFDDPAITWIMHKFNFDMHVLWAEGIELAGPVWCTMNQGRVEYNEHMSYSLEACLARIGLKKDDRVEQWISENKATEKVPIPGKKTTETKKFYYKVPFDIIVPYGLDDAKGAFSLARHQVKSITEQAKDFPPGAPTIVDAAKIEQRLTKTVFRMERVGVKIDRDFCGRAIQYERDRHEKAAQAFKRETERDYSQSPKLFAEIFESERERWAFTEKGNPSFESDVLKRFSSPAARAILDLRGAKSKLDFYHGFLYHADRDGIVHAQFKPGGTRTFRFSSSDPNMQNLTSEDATFCRACKEWFEEYAHKCPECAGTDLEHPEFLVRRAIVPRPGYLFFMPDFDQMEYKMMLDYAKHMMIVYLRSRGMAWDEGYFEVANKVRDGHDVHKATAEELVKAGVTWMKRKHAKNINFGLLYGEGIDLLAANLGLSRDEAAKIKAIYFRALPYVQRMVNTIMDTVKTRGWLKNWAGYKYNFPDRNFAYTGPNTVIQGGCAIVTKIAMNEIDEMFLKAKSRLVLSVHDELPCEIHESEAHLMPRKIVQAMESVYPHKYIPLTAGAEWSEKSLADKKKGYPV